MLLKTALILFLLLFNSAAASTDDMIIYIDSLLAQGKKVAVLLIDMQQVYVPSFSEDYSDIRIDDQRRLLMRLVKKENVTFIDVNITSQSLGEKHLATLPELHRQLKRKRYFRFIKATNDAFQEPAIFKGDENLEEVITGKLGTHLKSEGVTDIVPTGCFDGLCIRSTAEGALKEGFDVHVDRDINIFYNNILHGNTSREEVFERNTKDWQVLQEEFPNLHILPDTQRSQCLA